MTVIPLCLPHTYGNIDIFFMFLFNKISLWMAIHLYEVGTSDTETRRTFCDAKGAFLVEDVEKGISI